MVWPEVFFWYEKCRRNLSTVFHFWNHIGHALLVKILWSCFWGEWIKIFYFLKCCTGPWSKTSFCKFKSLNGSGLIFLHLGSSQEQPDVVDIESFSPQNKSSKACKIAETWTQDSERLNNTNLTYWCAHTVSEEKINVKRLLTWTWHYQSVTIIFTGWC